MPGQRQRRAARSPLLTILKVLYWFIFAISLVIVALYIAFSVIVRSPTVSQPTIPPVMMTVTPSDDPDTPEDESRGDPTTVPVPQGLQRKEDCHTFLLMGCDDGNGNADTIMVVTYDVPNQQVSVVSVPRDTLVDVSRKVKKINAAYGQGGVEQVQQEVSHLLGFPVDHYIMVNLKGFKALINAIGGVDFNVPMNMHYHDPTQNLYIDLNKGPQHLDGDKAMQLVRFRSGYSNADIGRIQTQQKFLTAVAKKLLSWQSVTKVNEFVDIFAKYVKTDLTVGNLAYFGIAALDLDTENGVQLHTLPGDGMVNYQGVTYYYELFPQETLEIINSGLNPYTEDLTLEQTHIFQVP